MVSCCVGVIWSDLLSISVCVCVHFKFRPNFTLDTSKCVQWGRQECCLCLEVQWVLCNCLEVFFFLPQLSFSAAWSRGTFSTRTWTYINSSALNCLVGFSSASVCFSSALVVFSLLSTSLFWIILLTSAFVCFILLSSTSDSLFCFCLLSSLFCFLL